MKRNRAVVPSGSVGKAGRRRWASGLAVAGLALSLSVGVPSAADAYTGGNGCISVANWSSGDWISTTWTKQLKNNCSGSKRVKVQYWGNNFNSSGYYWSGCVTLTSFASRNFTASWNHLSSSGSQFTGEWNYC